jgi:hypothetical protein
MLVLGIGICELWTFVVVWDLFSHVLLNGRCSLPIRAISSELYRVILYFVQSEKLGLRSTWILRNSYDRLPLLLMPSSILNVLMYEENNYCPSTLLGGESILYSAHQFMQIASFIE